MQRLKYLWCDILLTALVYSNVLWTFVIVFWILLSSNTVVCFPPTYGFISSQTRKLNFVQFEGFLMNYVFYFEHFNEPRKHLLLVSYLHFFLYLTLTDYRNLQFWFIISLSSLTSSLLLNKRLPSAAYHQCNTTS